MDRPLLVKNYTYKTEEIKDNKNICIFIKKLIRGTAKETIELHYGKRLNGFSELMKIFDIDLKTNLYTFDIRYYPSNMKIRSVKIYNMLDNSVVYTIGGLT